MSNALLDRLTGERDGLVEFTETLISKAAEEGRDLVETELQSIKSAEERIAQIEAQAQPIIDFEKRRMSAQILDTAVSSAPRQTASVEVVAEHRTLGEMWTESEQFRNYDGHGRSQTLHIPDWDQSVQLRAAADPIVTNADPGQKYLPNANKLVKDAVMVPFPLLSLVTPIEIGTSNSVDWLVVGEASGADVVAEKAAKPAVTWTETEASFKLETIAGWKKYTRQAAEDIPALRSIIDQKIRRAIDVKLNALGTAALLAAKVAGNTTTGVSKAPLIEVVRLAQATMLDRGYTSPVVLMNPADHAALDIYLLSKTLNGAVINGGAFGSQIIPVSGVTAGTAVVGDIGEALAYFYKNGLSIYTTDSDVSDGGAGAVTSDFRSNILTTLGEVRGKFGVTDASAVQFAVATP